MQKLVEKLHQSRKSKKGFTLIELIVVLVILAVLAAILVPTFVGYVDKAKKGSVEVEARDVLVAAQTIATEEYGAGHKGTYSATSETDVALSTDSLGYIVAVKSLAEIGSSAVISNITVTNGKVTGITYTSDGYTATYTATSGAGSWVVAKN